MTTRTLPAPSQAEHGELLKHAGLRSTGPRRAVIAVLGRRGHWSAADIFDEVSKDLSGTSLQAVYGVLAALSEVGLLRKIQLPGNPALYELRAEDNHHHLVCVRCGEVKDVPCAVGAEPCLTASVDHGYDIVAADVTFRGVCPDCRQAENVQA